MRPYDQYGFRTAKALRYAKWKPDEIPPLWWIQLLVAAPSEQARAYLLRHPVGDTPPEWWVDRIVEFHQKRPLAVTALIDLLQASSTERGRQFLESLTDFLIERGELTYQSGGQYDALMRSYDQLIEKRDAKARTRA